MLSVYKKQFTRSLSEPLVLDITGVGISGLTGSLFDPPQVTNIPDFEYTWNKEMSKLSISVDLRKFENADLLESCVLYISVGGEKSIALVEGYNGNVSNYTGLELKPVVNHIILNLGKFKLQADFKTKRGKIGQFIQGNSRNEVRGTGMLSSVITGNSYHIYRDDFETYLSHEQAKTERNREHRNTPWLNEKGEKKYHSRKVLELTDLNIWTSDISKTGRMDLELAYETGVHHLALNGEITYNTWEIEDGIERKVKENQKISIKDYGLDKIDFDFTHLGTKGVGEAKKARIDFKLNKNNGLIEYTLTPDDGRGESYIIYNLKASVKTETPQGKGRYLASKLTLVSKGKYKYWQVEHMNRAYHDPEKIDTSYYIRPYDTEKNPWSNKLFTIKTGLALAGTENPGAEIYKPVLKFQKAGESDWKEMPKVDIEPGKIDKESGLFFKATGFTSATSRDIISREGNKKLTEGKPYDPQWIEEIIKNQSKNSKGQGEIVVWEDIVGTRKYWIILEYYGKSNQADKNETSSISVTLYPTDKNETTTWQPRKEGTGEPLKTYKIEVLDTITSKTYSHEFVLVEEAKKQVDPYVKLSVDGIRVSKAGSIIDLPRTTSHTLSLETEPGNTSRRNYFLSFIPGNHQTAYYNNPKYIGGVVGDRLPIESGSFDTNGTVPFETYVTKVGGWEIEFGKITAISETPDFNPDYWKHVVDNPDPVVATIKMRGPSPYLRLSGNLTFTGLGAALCNVSTNTYTQTEVYEENELIPDRNSSFKRDLVLSSIGATSGNYHTDFDGNDYGDESGDLEFNITAQLGGELYVPPGMSTTKKVGYVEVYGVNQDGNRIKGVGNKLDVYLNTTSDYSIELSDIRGAAIMIPSSESYGGEYENYYRKDIQYNTRGVGEEINEDTRTFPKFSKTTHVYIEWDPEIKLPKDNIRLGVTSEDSVRQFYTGESWNRYSNKDPNIRTEWGSGWNTRIYHSWDTYPSLVGTGRWPWQQEVTFDTRRIRFQKEVVDKYSYSILYVGSFVLWVSDNNENGKIKIPIYLLDSISPLKVKRGEDTRIYLSVPDSPDSPRSSTFRVISNSGRGLENIVSEDTVDYSQYIFPELHTSVNSEGDVSCAGRFISGSRVDKVLHVGDYSLSFPQDSNILDIFQENDQPYKIGLIKGAPVMLKEAIEYQKNSIDSITRKNIGDGDSSDGKIKGPIFSLASNTNGESTIPKSVKREYIGDGAFRYRVIVADTGLKDIRLNSSSEISNENLRPIEYTELSDEEKDNLGLDYWQSRAHDYYSLTFDIPIAGAGSSNLRDHIFDLSGDLGNNSLLSGIVANPTISLGWYSRNLFDPRQFNVSKKLDWKDHLDRSNGRFGLIFQLANTNVVRKSELSKGHVILFPTDVRSSEDSKILDVELTQDDTNTWSTSKNEILGMYIRAVNIGYAASKIWKVEGEEPSVQSIYSKASMWEGTNNTTDCTVDRWWSESSYYDGNIINYDSNTGYITSTIPKNAGKDKKTVGVTFRVYYKTFEGNTSNSFYDVQFHVTLPGNPNAVPEDSDHNN